MELELEAEAEEVWLASMLPFSCLTTNKSKTRTFLKAGATDGYAQHKVRERDGERERMKEREKERQRER